MQQRLNTTDTFRVKGTNSSFRSRVASAILNNVTADTRQHLCNPGVIDIDQDPLGAPPRLIEDSAVYSNRVATEMLLASRSQQQNCLSLTRSMH